jgi:hypothetical protein
LADRDYLNKFSDDPAGLESHLQGPDAGMGGSYLRRAGGRDRGLRAAGRHDETDLLPARLRFTRQRNGAVNMHAALSLAVCHRQLPV